MNVSRTRSPRTVLAVVSLGNTSAAAGIWSGGRLAWTRRIPATRLGTGKLFAGAPGLDEVSAAAVASVVPRQERALAAELRRELGRKVTVHLLGSDLSSGLRLRVKSPRAVGADRLAGALAAHRRFGPAVVVDFGTAVTVNAVTAAGGFLGGAILPGPALAAAALSSGTARVKVPAPRRAVRPPGRSTAEAVAAGLTVGLAGAVDRLVAESTIALGGRATAVATGGGAALIVPLCRTKFQVLPDLVLEGLALALEQS